ncbi:unnamed protein product [Owenia fusiformis]|uniref:Uncharacterized protein n=1 Tax=Owenia fusiformis TaxID=6347 RepID=A0A8S4PSM1_OWEFU|nr:unnamed protein product [Owenia fusiformis]
MFSHIFFINILKTIYLRHVVILSGKLSKIWIEVSKVSIIQPLGYNGLVSLDATQFQVAEGQQFSIPIKKSGQQDEELSVVVQLQNPSANGGDDFIDISHATVFAPSGGDIVQTVTFTVRDDNIPEADEPFALELFITTGSGTVSEPNLANVIIIANDGAFGTFSFSSAPSLSVVEQLTETDVSLSVQRSRGTFGEITILYQVFAVNEDPLAVPGEDITPSVGNIVFAEGQSQREITIAVQPDQIPENDEVFIVRLMSATGGDSVNPEERPLLEESGVEITIQKNDAPIRFQNGNYRVDETEEITSLEIVIQRGLGDDGVSVIGPVDKPATVNYFVLSGSAVWDQDFTGINGTIGFGIGVTEYTIAVNILQDSIPEIAEHFTIELENPSGDVVLVDPAVATVTITANDDENGVLSLKTPDGAEFPQFRINEDETAQFTEFVVTRSGGTFGAVEIDWILERNDSNSDNVLLDISPKSGTVTFLEGDRSQFILLTLVQDLLPEIGERYMLHLLPETVTGGAKAGDILSGELIIEDSDSAYGILELAPDSEQSLITTNTPRKLQLTLTRDGGIFGDISASIHINMTDPTTDVTNILVPELPMKVTIPNSQIFYKFDVAIKETAFLKVDSTFEIYLTEVELASAAEVGPFNSPMLGENTKATVTVRQQDANGEVGFAATEDIFVAEPEGNFNQRIPLVLNREGVNGDVTVYWSMVGTGRYVASVTPDDTGVTSGNVTMLSGESTAEIVIQIMPDEIPETDEELIVTLTSVEPSGTQKLRLDSIQVRVTIKENDNPGGVFQFSGSMLSGYNMEEEGTPVIVSVERIGGALVTRFIQYYIHPDGETEFYGGTSVLKFGPGEYVKNDTIIAKGDGVPELFETYQLLLRSYGDDTAVIREGSTINITVEENDDPYGVLQFHPDSVLVFVDETKGDSKFLAEIRVLRTRGVFGTVLLDWSVTQSNSTDLRPLSGTLQFVEGQDNAIIQIETVSDELPEGSEVFDVVLSNPTGGSRLGTPTEATVTINKNDDAIHFKVPITQSTSESGSVEFTIVRDGELKTPATVKYRTIDGTAKSGELDYTAVVDGVLQFAIGEMEKVITIATLEDEIPETDEVFYVRLYDAQGDVVVFGNVEATVTIMANDEANGVFKFSPPFMKTGNEGTPISFDVTRDRGRFGEVHIYWQIYNNETDELVQPGTDFSENSDFITFLDQEQSKPIVLTPIADNVPEYLENFRLELLNATGGGPSGQVGVLSNMDQVVMIQIAENDDPYGVFAFPADSRELSIAEDFNPGEEEESRTTFTVVRKQGTFKDVQVAWEIFSYQIAGAGNLPSLKDLLFLGDVPEAVEVVEGGGRKETGSMVLNFTSQTGSYVNVPTEYQTSKADIETGFSISVWVKPENNTSGYLLSKSSVGGSIHYYGLRLDLAGDDTVIEFRYSVATDKNNQVAVKASDNSIEDGAWHHILLTVDNGLAEFFIDGASIGTSVLAGLNTQDGVGVLLVGAIEPGVDQYIGLMQDARVFSRKLDAGEIHELYETPSKLDVSPLSGYLTFPEGVDAMTITVTSLQDTEEEADETFAIKLISAKGGARVSDNDNTGIVKVLKSDNANGLFGFSDVCSPESTTNEAAIFSCPVERRRGDADTVSVDWEVQQMVRPDFTPLATEDFTAYQGQLIFEPGTRSQTLTVTAFNDANPELTENFRVVLTKARSADGIEGSTLTSGASIDEDTQSNTITIVENDHPYGLLQFSTSEDPPTLDDPMIVPAEQQPEVTVQEESVEVHLLVVRAQGLTGRVTVEWRTIDGTAKSAGKSPPDYIAGVNRLVFEENQRYAYINISIVDNLTPEDDKSFQVQLVNPTGGADIGLGSTITVTISHSDNAYGVFMFTGDSLNVMASEVGDMDYSLVNLTIVRSDGIIGPVNVTWEFPEAAKNDIVDITGIVSFKDQQREAELSIKIRGDTFPELDEVYTVSLVDSSKGSLGTEVSALITIAANDDPYGMFVIATDHRPIRVLEIPSDVNLTIERQRGMYGSVRVNYTTLRETEYYPYLPSNIARATDGVDFLSTSGSVTFTPDESKIVITIQILDDSDPEIDESVFIILNSVELLTGAQSRDVINSPRIGPDSDAYGQVIINQNDAANGVLQLSATHVSVHENNTGSVVDVVRTQGSFGEVTVKFEVITTNATYGFDYIVSSTDVVLSNEERTKSVPIEIIDDRIPELSEVFTIHLLNQITGGASLGMIQETQVVILPSDDPYGAFGFEKERISVEEPEDGETSTAQFAVVRIGGTLGVVAVTWKASLANGDVARDISPTTGTVYFVSNDARQNIEINILPDDDAEGVEEIVITLLTSTSGRVNYGQHQITLEIQPNDNPHGTVQFTAASFQLEETKTDSEQFISLNRSGGDYGELRVYYSTEELDLLTEAMKGGKQATSYFGATKEGARPKDIQGSPVNVVGLPNPLNSCGSVCLAAVACLSFQYNISNQGCTWFTTADDSSLLPDPSTNYYVKSLEMTRTLYAKQAYAGSDYLQVTSSYITIADGQRQGTIPLTIKADSIPELDELFFVKLTRVILMNIDVTNTNDNPTVGAQSSATVVIAANDDANGVFSIRSMDPFAEDDGHVVPVEERDRLSVELIVEREGGSIGSVSVTWGVVGGTATAGSDFTADGATLNFLPGETTRSLTLSIKDDTLPEDDETIIVELSNPEGGSILAPQKTVTVIVTANDYVGGLIGFTESSYVAKEGDTLEVNIARSEPGLGNVTVDWVIEALGTSLPSFQRFTTWNGTLKFPQGDLDNSLTLEILVDDIPKINQEYNIILREPQTEGVRESGGAAVDPQSYVASITIEGGNNPHGVFSFASSSRKLYTQEGDLTLKLIVDRKFGSIGAVNVFYTIRNGSLLEDTPPEGLADAGLDFTAISTSIEIADGAHSVQFEVTVFEDDIPEIDEEFIVELTKVELVSPIGSSFKPTIDVNGAKSQVTIEANDGTKGVVIFRLQDAKIETNETDRDIPLLIRRTQGTFGNVSVFCYAQSLGDGARPQLDYIFEARDIEFAAGESEKIVTVRIVDDNEPEPNEMFEIILASPRDGLALGDPSRAVITILESDGAGGSVEFANEDNITLSEPSDTSTANSKAEIRLTRGPGSFGIIYVPFRVETLFGDGNVTDVQPNNGYITFLNKETSATVEISATPDVLPEQAEHFKIILMPPEGGVGAGLGDTITKVITVAENDSPYGEMQIYPAGSRESSIDVEEAYQTLYFDVVRAFGTVGRVFVDVVTKASSATYSTGGNVTVSLIQQIPTNSVSKWYAFETGSAPDRYLILLNEHREGALTTSIGSDGTDGSYNADDVTQSVIYRWQGVYVPIQTIETDGAKAAIAFTIDGANYLAIGNHGSIGRYEARTRIYSMKQDGSLIVHQDLKTSGAMDVKFLEVDNQRYLIIANHFLNSGETRTSTDVYLWNNLIGQFNIVPVQQLQTRGASALKIFDIEGTVFMAVAQKYDSGGATYEINSVLYKLFPESSNQFAVFQSIPTQGAVDLEHFTIGDLHYLAIANHIDNLGSMNQNVVIYQWDAVTTTFESIQEIANVQVQSVHSYVASNGLRHLTVANAKGHSTIYTWNSETRLFTPISMTTASRDLYPIIISGNAGKQELMAIASTQPSNVSSINMVYLLGESDFIPRSMSLTFEPGQTEMRVAVNVLDDTIPEDDEIFSVSLTNPKDGANIGGNSDVTVNILSNDDGHGVIEFAEDSLEVTVEELLGRDNPVQLNVIRSKGSAGRVVIKWRATGTNGDMIDILPLEGQVEFAAGQSVSTITISVKDDVLPELQEAWTITLDEVIESGSSQESRGARIGTNSVALLSVLANDSPHGVVSWELPTVSTIEPATTSTVTAYILRQQGTKGTIQVFYITGQDYSIPTKEQAVSGIDYITRQGVVTMTPNVTRVAVEFTILADDIPEVAEIFLVNITKVELVGGGVSQDAMPSVQRDIMQIVIGENDNARGIISFDVTKGNEGRVDAYEGQLVDLKLSRTDGFFGAVSAIWQAMPISPTTTDDFSPAGGVVEFIEGQEEAYININIVDDTIAETLELFDVQLLRVTGSAALGAESSRTVRVGIRKNDSPNGLFGFQSTELSVRESDSPNDPQGRVTVVVERTMGTEGVVNIQWQLSPDAAYDFEEPLSGRITFGVGDYIKTITLQTSPDNILEGLEQFTISLLSADNNADISPTHAGATISILPNEGSSGLIAILDDSQQVIIGEPTDSYDGEVQIRLTRGEGIYGDVRVTWQIAPWDANFIQNQGDVRFTDLQQFATIVIKSKGDATPELRSQYTLTITSADNNAIIDGVKNQAAILFAASDYPHGLFEFAQPPEIVVNEDTGQVSVTVERGAGLVGQVRVAFSTVDGEAEAGQDFDGSSGSITFDQGQQRQSIIISILDDDKPEGPEHFYVNLTSAELQSHSDNNYTMLNGVQLDMAPGLGPLAVKSVTIEKNDNAEGTLEFDTKAASFIISEDIGVARIPVTRLQGSYGVVSATFTSRNLTATPGVDYFINDGEVIFQDGVDHMTINASIFDDSTREFQEQFEVVLTGAKGGASLGDRQVSLVTIAKSDYPNGRFGFTGQTNIVIENPAQPRQFTLSIERTGGLQGQQTRGLVAYLGSKRQFTLSIERTGGLLWQQTVSIAYLILAQVQTNIVIENPAQPRQFTLSIERTGGLLGQQTLHWRIMGPNNPELILDETNDIGVTTGVRETVEGVLTWDDSEGGVKMLTLNIKPYTDWEIEKTYVIEIARIEGSTPTTGNGELSPLAGNVTLKILKYGHPNGIVKFTGIAKTTRGVTEPTNGPLEVTFPIYRREDTGTVGDIQIQWRVTGPGDDVGADIGPVTGVTSLLSEKREGSITLSVLPDSVPELSETFTLELVSVEGGAEIDDTFNTSSILVIYNDDPHGVFSIFSQYQTVVVDPADLNRRYVRLNITRGAGTFGRVRVSFGITYDQVQTGVSYIPSAGDVIFQDGQIDGVTNIQVEYDAFLELDATFTVRLNDLTFLDAEVKTPPRFTDVPSDTSAKVTVPSIAANSKVGFSATVITANEGTGLVELTVERLGSYGSVDVSWVTGYPGNERPLGFTTGALTPDSGTVSLDHGEESKSFTVQLTPQVDTAEAFATHLPLKPTSNIGGGARLRTGFTTCRIDPHGVVRFAEVSRVVKISEEVREVTLTIERIYGSLDNIQIDYQTIDGTAVGGSLDPQFDYVTIDQGSLTMAAMQISATILIQINQDNFPEQDENFSIHLTRVQKLPSSSGPFADVSPRVSGMFSTANITIQGNDNPYGVLSVIATPSLVPEPGVAQIRVSRGRGGSFGEISVQLRTIGGGEAWSNTVVPEVSDATDTIAQALGVRDESRRALGGQDYVILDQMITFTNEDTEDKLVTITVVPDNIPEPDESLFVYLTSPTGGARIAGGTSDGGLFGYAMVNITRNDLWNGEIGFTDDSKFVTSEGEIKATLTLTRGNAFYYDVIVGWVVSDEKWRDQLVNTEGTVLCTGGFDKCEFDILLVDDNKPEFKDSFIVELVESSIRPTGSATLDPRRTIANVTIPDNDYPNGLVLFDESSRVKNIDKDAKVVRLKVDCLQRVSRMEKIVKVNYETFEIQNTNMLIAGVKVYPALSGADFMRKSGVVTFDLNVDSQFIDITLDPFSASDNPYPKMFQIVLSSPTNQSSLDSEFSVANITIMDLQEIDIWNILPEAQKQLTDTTITSIINDLDDAIRKPLVENELHVTQEILDTISEEGSRRVLPSGIKANMMDVFCRLLDPSRTDSTRGFWKLSQSYERFTYTFLTNEPCETSNLIVYNECKWSRFSVARWYPDSLNGYRYMASRDDYFTIPSALLSVEDGKDSDNPTCKDAHFIEYLSEQWFQKDETPMLLNNRVITIGIKGRASNFIDQPVKYRIHTPNRQIASRRSQCVYFNEPSEQWSGVADVCVVKNNLDLAIDNFVDCECKHMSSYAVRADVKDPNLVGYPIWFHISCFICMAGLLSAILSHHICAMQPMFAANLLMHMCFAAMATQVCYVVAAYLSPYYILVQTLDVSNYKCIVMGLFLHYFFMAQFTWMMTQAVNLWKTLVMNDEHTARKYVLFFLLGWGTPALIVAIFYVVTYNLYRYVYPDMPIDFIYGDVGNNGEICFITNAYAGLGGILAPVLICMMVVGIIFIQAYQLKAQWEAYDDMYRGRFNKYEIRTLLLFWTLIVLSWLWGGLHLAYGQLWMLILFCIFNILQGLYAFVVYFCLRNPCLPCFHKPEKHGSYTINITGSDPNATADYMIHPVSGTGSLHGSKASLLNESWERGSVGHQGPLMRVKRTPPQSHPGNIYVHPPSPYDTKPPPQAPSIGIGEDPGESQDFDDLIFALKTGGGFTPSEMSAQMESTLQDPEESTASPGYEMRRIAIADTHL